MHELENPKISKYMLTIDNVFWYPRYLFPIGKCYLWSSTVADISVLKIVYYILLLTWKNISMSYATFAYSCPMAAPSLMNFGFDSVVLVIGACAARFLCSLAQWCMTGN